MTDLDPKALEAAVHGLSCDDQFALATRIAANVGYVLEPAPTGQPKFLRGDRVRKISGSSWQGVVVGDYSSSLTPEGYDVESEREPGSVQLYPAAALELVPTRDAREGE